MSAEIGDDEFELSVYAMNNRGAFQRSLNLSSRVSDDYDESEDNNVKKENKSSFKPTCRLLFARIFFDIKSKAIKWDEKISKSENEKLILLNFISPKTDLNKYLNSAHCDDLLKDDFKWQFGGIKSGVDATSGSYIYGRLGKFRGRMSNYFNEIEGDFKHRFRHGQHVCNFLIDLKNHIFVYELKRNLGSKEPILVIEELFNSYYALSEQISLEPLKDRTKVAKKISELRVITAVKLNLHVTNPNSTHLSKKMDEYIQNFGAYKFIIELISSNKKTGIDLDSNNGILRSGLSLAEEGYGEAEIQGIKKRKWKHNVQTIDTENLQALREVDLEQTDEENIKIFIKTILDILKMYRLD